MAANIISGVPFGYAAPLSTPGIPIGATNKNELLTADMTERQLLVLQANLLLAILTELRLSNEKLFPTVNWENERLTYGSAFAADIEDLQVQ